MTDVLDLRGLKCPQPVLKVAIHAHTAPAGTVLDLQADCESFPRDIEKWCADTGRVLMSLVDRGAHHEATVQL